MNTRFSAVGNDGLSKSSHVDQPVIWIENGPFKLLVSHPLTYTIGTRFVSEECSLIHTSFARTLQISPKKLAFSRRHTIINQYKSVAIDFRRVEMPNKRREIIITAYYEIDQD
ncbi:hypothetical protein AVEN_271180-1 [Araneus ventricosus]|uniref:Uncharacterized protein n=1 Tax=Araneus ventricosus TaxID=182803 RepID=A0A4Y2P775_ARAVE|nr:hypothetical protein AVEN_271180-1 [Araneus ventricosus]